ncbi:MAG TPA: aldose epimerase family protein [Candidatus Baltobacteraceae bacterium]
MADLTLQNVRGARVTLNRLGAAIESIVVPDRDGNLGEVTVPAGNSAGKTIGRYANRIAGASFELDGHTYELLANEGRNTLHGGPDGFSKRAWDIKDDSFVLKSPDGDQGFPGTLECRVRYTWSDDCALTIDYTATTDKPTVINFTNHVYFNLSGWGGVEQHQLQVSASSYTPLDEELIPTGEIANVILTPYDFRAMRALGSHKYDVNLAIDGWNKTLRRVAELRDTNSGRRIIVETTQPGFQLYTGKEGAVAMELQHFADSPHHPNFPSTVLRPGETFTATTVYRFEVLY